MPDGPKIEFVSTEFDWMPHPPYADAGGGVISENPVFWVLEAYVTPFDELIGDDQEASVVSELEVGRVIGLGLVVVDGDTDSQEYDQYRTAEGNQVFSADNFVDGLLLGAGGDIPDDSAVRADSWGRIKASMR